MNTRRNNEIKAVLTAFTVTAALVSGLLTIRDADAAPPKKSTVTVKRAKKSKPVYVKMSGNRRAAETRAQQLYASALAQKAADEQAVIDARIAAQEANAQVAAQASATQQNGPVYPVATFGPQFSLPGGNNSGILVIGNGYGNGGTNFGGFTLPQNNTVAYPTFPGFTGYSGFASPTFGQGFSSGGTNVIGYPTVF